MVLPRAQMMTLDEVRHRRDDRRVEVRLGRRIGRRFQPRAPAQPRIYLVISQHESPDPGVQPEKSRQPRGSGRAVRVVQRLEQSGADEGRAFCEQALCLPALNLAATQQVEDEIGTGPLTGDVILQIGVEPVVPSPQFRGQADDDRLKLPCGQAEELAEPRQREHHSRLPGALDPFGDLGRKRGEGTVIRRGIARALRLRRRAEQPVNFLAGNEGSPRQLRVWVRVAVAGQPRGAQPDQQVQPPQLIPQVLQVMRIGLRRGAHGVTSKRNVRWNRPDTSTVTS